MTILDFQPKKLSLRWGQLFTTFLQTPQERTGESKRAETGETEPSQSLHAFMQQTLNEHRGSKLDDALPTSRHEPKSPRHTPDGSEANKCSSGPLV